MKAFFVTTVVLSAVVLVLLAVVFRSAQARNVLKFGRNALWLYIAIVFALALIQLYREGL